MIKDVATFRAIPMPGHAITGKSLHGGIALRKGSVIELVFDKLKINSSSYFPNIERSAPVISLDPIGSISNDIRKI